MESPNPYSQTNRFWDVPDILKIVQDQPMNADQIREALKISPYDKREIYRLSQVLLELGNSGTLRRDKATQTYRAPRPTTTA